jgi:hypothetical protein
MTTIAMERARSRRGGGWSLPAIPVDTAFVPDGRPKGASTVRPQVMQAGTTVTVGKIPAAIVAAIVGAVGGGDGRRRLPEPQAS